VGLKYRFPTGAELEIRVEEPMAALTIYLSRLIGLSTLMVALSMLADKSQAMETVRTVVQDRPVLIVLGMLGTAAGLAIVLGHQVWSGGVLPVVVTVIGWVSLIRGTILLFLSQDATARLVDWFISASSCTSTLDSPRFLDCI
jgi:hypothetical protein